MLLPSRSSGSAPYQSGDFPFRERVLILMLSAKAVLLAAHGLGLARRIAENQSVAVSGIEDLDEHGAAFADYRKRVAVGTQLVQKTVDVNGKDLRERLLPKASFQRLERVLIASYDSNGRMRGVEKRSVQISKGESTHSIPCAASSGGYKLFLLKDGSEPVCVATAIDPFAKIFSVTFVDWNGAVVSKQQVSAGDSAAPPPAPKRDGYFFVGWDREFSKINSDCIIAAQYKANVTPTLYVSSVSATAGAKNVAVRISVRNNPGILGLKIRLSYNDDALTLTKAVSGEAFDNYLTMTSPRKFTSGRNLLWDGVEIQTEDVRDGDIVTLWTHS